PSNSAATIARSVCTARPSLRRSRGRHRQTSLQSFDRRCRPIDRDILAGSAQMRASTGSASCSATERPRLGVPSDAVLYRCPPLSQHVLIVPLEGVVATAAPGDDLICPVEIFASAPRGPVGGRGECHV